MRTSTNQYHEGQLQNGYDYDLQVWVVAGIIQDCGHPGEMSTPGKPCCNARQHAGERITNVRAQLSI